MVRAVDNELSIFIIVSSSRSSCVANVRDDSEFLKVVCLLFCELISDLLFELHYFLIYSRCSFSLNNVHYGSSHSFWDITPLVIMLI